MPAQRTGALRAAKPAALVSARRNRALGAGVAACMVAGLGTTLIVQSAAPASSAAAGELPSVADLTAAAPQSFTADLAVGSSASARDEAPSVTLEPTPTPTSSPSSSTTASPETDSADSNSTDSTSSGSAAIVGDDPASIKALAQQLLAEAGLSGEWSCFDYIITHESNWNPYAENPSSGAYGLPQSLPGNKMASIADDWATNPATQIKWAIGYMNDVYGSPCGAYSFWLANSHY